MNNGYNDWFYFSKAERRGIFGLLLLLIALIFLPKTFPFFQKKSEPIDFESRYQSFAEKQEDYNKAATIETQIEQNQNQSPNKTKKAVGQINEEKNTTPKEYQVKQAQAKKPVSAPAQKKKEKTPLRININEATAEEFAQLRGIGEVYSNRIVKFRNALGGFISIDQVSDTYGIEEETFSLIRKQLVISPNFRPTTINLNTATVDQLKNHPYISPQLAKQIVNYREKVHPFESQNDVKSLYFVDETLFKKLQPYIVW